MCVLAKGIATRKVPPPPYRIINGELNCIKFRVQGAHIYVYVYVCITRVSGPSITNVFSPN